MMDERELIVQSLNGEAVATVRELKSGEFVIESENRAARRAISILIDRGSKPGLIISHDHRQKTRNGQIFRMYGRWSKPGDPDFLEALADGLVEFDFFAYTVELLHH